MNFRVWKRKITRRWPATVGEVGKVGWPRRSNMEREKIQIRQVT